MLIGVVSDTHGSLRNSQLAVRMLEQFDLAAVLHCGDICGLAIAACFRQWPTHYVLGNCDDDSTAWNDAISAAGGTFHSRFAELTLGERRIAVLHSDDRSLFERTISSQSYDLVCYGHTHQAEQHRVGKTLVLNPGALFRAKPLSLAIVDLATMKAEHLPLE